jgi:Fe-S-cluster containining protein
MKDTVGFSTIPLSRRYPAREGQPILVAVDSRVFTTSYFGVCLSCTYCRDACCQHGVDVDGATVQRILAEADALEQFVGIPRDSWFEREEIDPEMPGGSTRRSRTVDGACVFLNRAGRGCLLHAHAINTGRDYHDLKPLVSALFPLTFEEGVLTVSDELEESSLICAGEGPTAYSSCRTELAFYFGEECVRELDALNMNGNQPPLL